MHRADLDTHALRFDLAQDRLNHLEEKTRAIFQAPAVFVFTQVGGGVVQKLRDQIEIVSQYLDTIEARLPSRFRAARAKSATVT